MEDIGQKCIKWLMFIFNLFLLITGLALTIAGSVAQAKYKHFSAFFVNDSIHAPVLLIIVGIAIFIIPFVGFSGAARESYYMLTVFAVLLGILFVVQIAGGIAAFVEKGKINDLLAPGLNRTVHNYYYNETSDEQRKDLDLLQSTFTCCGASSFADWTNPAITPVHSSIPKSCCRNTTRCDTNDTVAIDTCATNPDDCPVFTCGCEPVVRNYLDKAIAIVGGIAIGLAVIELICIGFACYHAKRIRSGYTYA